LYDHIDARFKRETNSPTLQSVNPRKAEVLYTYLGASVGNGRVLSRAEVDAIPLEELERAVARALHDFPSWAKPETPRLRSTPAQRLDSANAILAEVDKRKTAMRNATQPTPGSKKVALNALPAHLRLAAANGDRQLAHLIEAKK
jgi:hypothetical protein